MTIVAIVGDCTTTTCLAMAAGWPVDDGALILEADPSGGSLAGWLDTPNSPSLATIVANSRGAPADEVMSTVVAMTHRSDSGIRFVSAPFRSLPAHRAIEEASETVVPALAAAGLVVLADLGRRDPGHLPTSVVESATATLVVHRQHSASAAAAAVRLDRLVEMVEVLAVSAQHLVLAVVGDDPFEPAEIAQHVDTSVPGALADAVTLADDSLAAAVLAGRAGVSAGRLRRLPLMRSAAGLVSRLALGSTSTLTRPGALS
jgi:hypothetical protein